MPTWFRDILLGLFVAYIVNAIKPQLLPFVLTAIALVLTWDFGSAKARRLFLGLTSKIGKKMSLILVFVGSGLLGIIYFSAIIRLAPSQPNTPSFPDPDKFATDIVKKLKEDEPKLKSEPDSTAIPDAHSVLRPIPSQALGPNLIKVSTVRMSKDGTDGLRIDVVLLNTSTINLVVTANPSVLVNSVPVYLDLADMHPFTLQGGGTQRLVYPPSGVLHFNEVQSGKVRLDISLSFRYSDPVSDLSNFAAYSGHFDKDVHEFISNSEFVDERPSAGKVSFSAEPQGVPLFVGAIAFESFGIRIHSEAMIVKGDLFAELVSVDGYNPLQKLPIELQWQERGFYEAYVELFRFNVTSWLIQNGDKPDLWSIDVPNNRSKPQPGTPEIMWNFLDASNHKFVVQITYFGKKYKRQVVANRLTNGSALYSLSVE